MNFEIESDKPISQAFIDLQKETFWQAATYIQNLDYRRNTNKTNSLVVLEDGFGTCSTKHALLKRLADENLKSDFQLMLGIFTMSGSNTPKIMPVLEYYALSEIPEGHNYLKWNQQIIDFTSRTWRKENFEPFLLKEIEIIPEQITDFKVLFHQNFLKDWLDQHPEIPYSLEELWKIREECILALSQ